MRIRKHKSDSKEWNEIIQVLENNRRKTRSLSCGPIPSLTNILLTLIVFASISIFFISQYLPTNNQTIKFDEQKELKTTQYDMPYPLPSLDEMIEILDKMNDEKAFKFYDSHIPQSTNDYNMNHLRVIQQINESNQNLKHCVEINTKNIEFPIGIPQIEQRQQQDLYSQPALFCILYSPGFTSGMSTFNELEYWSFNDNFPCGHNLVSPRRCLKNKTARIIADSMHFTTTNNERGLNMAILVSGDACSSFQHFAAWIPIRYAMIHEWLMQISQNRQNEKIPHLNITIATNWNDQKDSIHNWFWKAMGFEQQTNILNEYVTVTLLDINGWCAVDKHAYYSPFFVAPFILNSDPHKTTKDVISPMYSWNLMHSIKPYLSHIGIERDVIIYLDRGTISKRGVRNNKEVRQYLQKFADDYGYELVIRGHYGKQHSFDFEKELFSRSMITIGPHGGAFANMIFMQSDSFIVEFDGWENKEHRTIFYSLSQANGLHYFYLAPLNFTYQGQAMDINIKHLDIVMNRIVKQINVTNIV